VCHCGINIGGVVNVPEVVEYAKTLPNVAHAERNLYTCSSEGLRKIKEAIEKYNLNRVIVASCTPRTHEPLFRATTSENNVLGCTPTSQKKQQKRQRKSFAWLLPRLVCFSHRKSQK